MKRLAALAVLAVAGCSDANVSRDPATLYRNSPITPSMRIHFASFDASEKTPYNLNNCQMTARVLNSNVAALAEEEGREQNLDFGFWCEPGPYREHGTTFPRFDSAYPTR